MSYNAMCQQIGKIHQWKQDREKVSFHSNPKERQSQILSKFCMIALTSHSSKVMLKTLQTRLQPYVNWELLDVQAGFRAEKPEIKLPISTGS